MSQKRWPKGSRRGGQFASKPRAETAQLEQSIDLTKQSFEDRTANSSDGAGDGRAWMEVSDPKRQALMKEADLYLAELIEEFGAPSPEQVASAKAFVESIRNAKAANSRA